MTEPLLQLTGITRSFTAGDREFLALNNINLTINAGEMVAIIGASGSGKSTLMNILGCLDYATAGSYRINGQETRDLDNQAWPSCAAITLVSSSSVTTCCRI